MDAAFKRHHVIRQAFHATRQRFVHKSAFRAYLQQLIINPITMKTLNALVGIALIAILASFAPFGGEGFTMHVNNKLLVENYFTSRSTTPLVSLDALTDKDQITVAYNECGKAGTNRALTLKDDAGKTLKEWRFSDSPAVAAPMNIQASEILKFKKDDLKALTLTYTSNMVTYRVLVTLSAGNETQASIK
jgi:hypothetical protein